MAKIPLRVYLREIEDAIDENQYDEAVAHCRHILKSFPKHIDTYRNLGKAYLEAQKFGNAADIFERVLSAVPDDFVAHVGMSIVREDEENIETAVWHMERAFETQPYNPAIQGEIKRLYGLRDGMEPAKARLTQGALARMYAKGGHYKQAIAELRSTLAQDPNRPDLLAPLAEMYAQNGQKVEAIQTCSTILRDLPYCLKANRLLAQLLEGTEREDERKKCLQRLYALDPYEAHVSELVLEAEDVPDQAVTLERMHWDGTSTMVDAGEEPAWESSPISLGQADALEEGIPDWLSSASEDAPESDESIFPVEDSESEIPSWMQDAGWGPSTGEFDEQAASFSFDEEEDAGDDGEAIAADLPDWIRDMAPEAGAAGSILDDDAEKIEAIFSDSQPDPTSDDTLDWLQDIEVDSPDSILEPEAEAQPDDEALPDWFQSEESAQTAESDSLDWLSDLPKDPADKLPKPDEENVSELPEWMSANENKSEPDAGDDGEGIPDWLQGGEEDSATGLDAEPAPAETQPGGVTDFLQGLQTDSIDEKAEAKIGADDDLPDWLQSSDEPAQESSFALATEGDALDLPEWSQETEPEAAASPQIESPQEEDNSLDWLDDLNVQSESEQSPQATGDDIPDWLLIEENQDGIDVSEDEIQQPESESADDEIPDWLKVSGAATATALADEFIDSAEPEPGLPQTEEEISTEDMPDWLQGLEEASAETLEEVESQVDSEIPDWLDNLAGDELPQEQALEAAGHTVEAQSENKQISPEDELSPTKKRRITASLALEAEDDEEVRSPSHEGIQMETEDDTGDQTEIPDWLAESESGGAEPPDGSDEEPAFPEWLAEPAHPAEPLESQGETPEFEDADAAMAWLEGLAAKQGVSEEELISSPDERPDSPPEWAQAETRQTEKPVEEAAPPSDEIPDWLKDSPKEQEAVQPHESVAEETESSPPDDIDWLQDLEKTAHPEESDLDETQPDDGIPDWLKDTAVEPASEEPVGAEVEVTPEPADAPEFEDADAAMAWLEGLAAKQGVAEEELLSSPDERPESPPDWVQETMEAGDDLTDKTVETKAVAELEIEEDTAIAGVGEIDEAEDIPDWLKEGAFAPPVEQTADTIETHTSDESATPTAADVEIEAAEIEEEEVGGAPDTPDWLKDLDAEEIQETGSVEDEAVGWLVSSEDDAEAMTDDEDVPDWLKEMRAEEAQTSETAATEGDEEVEIASEGDYSPGWLDTMSSEAQLEELAQDESPAVQDELPDWLQDTAIAKPSEPAEIENQAVEKDDQVPDWLKAEIEKEEALEDPPRPDDATWIREIGKDVPSYEFESPPEKPKTEEFSKKELPDWLQDFDSDEEQPAQSAQAETVADGPQEEYTWQPSGAEIETLPEEKLDLNKASLIQMERLPGMGFSRAQIIFSHREEHGPFSKFEELLELPGITPDTLNSIQDYIEIKPKGEPSPKKVEEEDTDLAPIAAPEEVIREPRPIIPIDEAEDQHHAKQIEAQQKLAQGEISGAMTTYNQLIKKGKRLEEVIEDLKAASARHPRNAEVLQSLGDAYMRADRLQEALDTYSKAEKLLQ